MERLTFALALPLTLGFLFGLAPVLSTNLVVRLYPKAHPQRAELVAELYKVPFHLRVTWAWQCLGLGLTEGVPARRAARRERGLFTWSRRFADVTISIATLVIILPVFASAAVLVKLTSRGPVFDVLRHDCSGCCDFKYRVFRVRRYSGGQNDLTFVGRRLRHLSIDMTPLLVSAIRGHMTLVGRGPRVLIVTKADQPGIGLVHSASGPCSWVD